MTDHIQNDGNDEIVHDHNHDGIDRRGFLKCMAWAGTGLLCVLSSGILKSYALSEISDYHASAGDFTFVQISDSHIGFSKAANKDVIGTFQEAITKINTLPMEPDFILHTGDLSHLAKSDEFDTVDQVLKSAKTKTGQVFYVPGEHDVAGDNGMQYLARYGKGTQGSGWYSFDHRGVHFIGLVNVVDLKAGGLGLLGPEQLVWLEQDLKNRSSSTPIVVFAHIPLWTVYPDWGWGTDDSEQALSYLRRFGSVTVLNGHIHQTLQKVEGNITFHTAMSTAFPQPAPGAAPSPGPMTVPGDQLRSMLGITAVNYLQGRRSLALVDSTLASTTSLALTQSASSSGTVHVSIDNFSFTPGKLSIAAGTEVTWVNHDDIPHNIVSTTQAFKSPVLDTDDKFTYRFTTPGTYAYYCGFHPRMTGTIVVN